jgi:membrane protein YqaA with SNARE-associated domain
VQRFVDFLVPLAESYGGFGLAIVAFLDSSFLSLPEVNDIAIVGLVIQRPDRWLYYAATTTIGSIGGCYALYFISRRGGEALLRRRFTDERLTKAIALFKKYGVLAIIVPSILPPPTPFKIFVLLAGVTKVKPAHFILAVAVGRGFRYGGEALLAVWYGEQATQFIKQNLAQVSIWLALAVALFGIALLVWRRRRAA